MRYINVEILLSYICDILTLQQQIDCKRERCTQYALHQHPS